MGTANAINRLTQLRLVPMQRTVVILLTAWLTASLAGCSSSNDEAPHANDDVVKTVTAAPNGSATTATQSQTTSQGGAGGGNKAPTAGLGADKTSGPAPLKVVFSLDGSDPDGDALSWSLDADGDGTPDATGNSLPKDLSFEYAQLGNYQVKLEVSDGKAVTPKALTIMVIDGSVELTPIVIEGTITGAWLGAPLVGGTYATAPNEHAWTLLGPAPAIVATLTWDDYAVDLDFCLYAPDGTEAGCVTNYNEPTGVVYNAEEDPVVVEDKALLAMAGEWTVEVYSAGSYASKYTVTITFD
jgi:PKD repeat protein